MTDSNNNQTGASLGSTVGAFLAALCCLGFTPFLSLLTAIGAGFLINDFILIPLLLVFLVLGGLSLQRSIKKHQDKRPLWLHLASSIILVIFTFISPIVAGIGIIGLMAAPLWNLVLLRKKPTTPVSSSPL